MGDRRASLHCTARILAFPVSFAPSLPFQQMRNICYNTPSHTYEMTFILLPYTYDLTKKDLLLLKHRL